MGQRIDALFGRSANEYNILKE